MEIRRFERVYSAKLQILFILFNLFKHKADDTHFGTNNR